jgi:nucleobase:cation symporter-1, NCS1 family
VTLSAQGGGAILARLAPGTFATTKGGANTAALGLCFVLAAGVTVLVGVFGHALIMRVQKYLTWAFVVLTVVYMGLTLPKLDLSAAAKLPNGGPGVFLGGAIFAATLLGLGWVNCGADYSRYLPRRSSPGGVVGWTTLGGALPPVVLLVFGALLAGGDPALAKAAGADPVGALAGTLPTWFLVPYLVTAIGGFLAGSIMDIYSSGLSLLALGVPLRRHLAVLVDGTLMVLGGWYLLFVSTSFLATFQAFLAIVGVVMAAWVAVFLVDMWRFRANGSGYDLKLLTPRSGGGYAVNGPGVVALVAATVVGLGLITSTDPNIAKVVGFLFTAAAKKSWLGSAGIGVVVALLLAGALYAVLTLFWRPRRS